jgi:hypothetical protein
MIEDSFAQPFYTRGTLNIVEKAWRHTNPHFAYFFLGGGGALWH